VPSNAPLGPVLLEGVPPEFKVQSKLSPVSCDHCPKVFSKPSLYGNDATVPLQVGSPPPVLHPLTKETI